MSDQPPQDKQLPHQTDEGIESAANSVAEHNTQNKDFFSRISITLLILVIMAAVFMWQWLDERRTINDIQQQIAIKFDQVNENNKANKHFLEQNRDQLGELSARLSALESRYSEIQNQHGTKENLNSDLAASRDETALAEVEQMLLNAAEQLQLSGNVRAALIFMQSADARLQHMNRPAIRGLSRIIGKDMDKLRAMPSVDVTGINRQLNKLISAVDELPLAYQQRAAVEPNVKTTQGGHGEAPDNSAASLSKSVVPSQDETTGRKLLREFWQEMKQLVQIENTGKDEIPLLHPDQQFFLRENLKLRLLSARIALLSRDEIVFRQELKSTQVWTARFFDTKSSAVSDMLAAMKKLSATRISVELPDLSSSLQAVRNYRLTSEKAVR